VILDEILDHKRGELARARARVAPEELARRAREVVEPTRGFRHTLMSAPAPRIVAEVKRRSPSKGLIRQDFDPVDCAVAYAQGGAAALSVLTDEHFFGGHLDHLEKVRRAVELPLLRKDFAIDPYQIDEARVAGADAVLLIASALAPDQIETLRRHALSLGLDVLVEVHDEAQLEVALASGADLVGINNRNLHTFETTLETTLELHQRIPDDRVVVTESGILSREDVARLRAHGVHAFLVGEAFMQAPDPGGRLRELFDLS
jgi:indole-3-glycerol phosphate synthase